MHIKKPCSDLYIQADFTWQKIYYEKKEIHHPLFAIQKHKQYLNETFYFISIILCMNYELIRWKKLSTISANGSGQSKGHSNDSGRIR